MADLENDISKEELQKEIVEILDKASLDKTSTKKVIQKLEQKLGIDLSSKKKLIDQLVMDYVNTMDSDEDSTEDEPPVKAVSKKKAKKQNVDEEDDEHDDSNDSDWGYHHEEHLLDRYSDDDYCNLPQESTISTSRMRHASLPSKAVILKKVPPANEEDESDIFGKLTAKKLKILSNEQRDAMMIHINQLFYEKRYNRPSPQTRRVPNKPTIMPAPCQNGAKKNMPRATKFQMNAKKLYRVNRIPHNLIPFKISDLPRELLMANAKGPAKIVLPESLRSEKYLKVAVQDLLKLPGVSAANAPQSDVPVAVVPMSDAPLADVPMSDVPEPVVQEAATPKPVVPPPAEEKAKI